MLIFPQRSRTPNSDHDGHALSGNPLSWVHLCRSRAILTARGGARSRAFCRSADGCRPRLTHADKAGSGARRVHDDRDPGQADQGADDVVAVGPITIGDHAPSQRPGDEHPAVGGQNAPEVGVRLQGGDEPVRAKREHTGTDPDPPAVFAHALPDQPGAADLQQGG
jgi:hypothetical protein